MDPLKQLPFSKLVSGAAALLLAALPVQAHGDPEQEVDVSLVVVSAAEDAIALFDPDSGERRAFFRVGNGPTSAAPVPGTSTSFESFSLDGDRDVNSASEISTTSGFAQQSFKVRGRFGFGAMEACKAESSPGAGSIAWRCVRTPSACS